MSSKKFLKIVLFIFFCLIVIFQLILFYNPYLGTNTHEQYVYFKRDWIRSQIGSYNLNKENIVVLGDSTTTSGFLPNIFDNNSGTTNTINLSIVSSDAQKHLYFLKDFMKYNYIPDVIIWYPTTPRPLENYLNASKEEVFDYYYITNNLRFILDYYFPALNIEKITNLLLNIFKNRDEINFVISELIKERGTYYWNGNKFGTVGENYSDKDYDNSKYPILIGTDEIYKNYLFEFLDFTYKNSIRVFIISPPMVIGSSLQYDKIPNIFLDIKSKYKNVYLSNILTKTYYPSELFFDRGHMNYNGAHIYTNDILKSYQEIFIK